MRIRALRRRESRAPDTDGQSRHTSLSSLGIYAKPTFDAVAAATAAIDPDRRH